METATCTHEENLEPGGYGKTRGTCRICKQVRIYDLKLDAAGEQKPPVVVELGEIDGKVVIPNAGDKLKLSVADMAKLDDASKGENEPSETKEPTKVRKRQTEPSATKKPTKVKRGKYRERRLQELEKNKDAIISDYYSMKLRAFLEKWHMSSTTWRKLRAAWRVEEEHLARVRPHPAAVAQISDDGLPPFPLFNDNWMPTVQIEWLRTYQALKCRLTEQKG